MMNGLCFKRQNNTIRKLTAKHVTILKYSWPELREIDPLIDSKKIKRIGITEAD
jgi:hypothetical protein